MHNILKILVFLITAATSTAFAEQAPEPANNALCHVESDAPTGLRRLVAAYPDFLCGATATELLWKDGTRMPYETRDRTIEMDEEERLNLADLRDQMEQPYPQNIDAPPPKFDQDPGRYRCQDFFTKMYGASQKEVSQNTGKIKWLGGKVVRFHLHNDAIRRLEEVKADLEKLPPKLRKIATPSSGTFVWRKVKTKQTAQGNQTARLSAHSFAIAIDIAVPHSDFWGWNRPDKDGHYAYKNRIPMEIVEIFEKHGFIWGGRWAHFDSMHFEYRPELIDAFSK